MSDDKNIELFFKRDDEKAKIIINEKEYLISTHFSLNDGERFIDEYIKDGDDKKALAIIIIDKIREEDYENIPLLQDVIDTQDESFEAYIIAVVSDSEELTNLYDDIDTEISIRKRFAIAYKTYTDGWAKRLKESVQPFIHTIETMQKSIDYSWITKMQDTISRLSTPWMEATKSMMRTSQIIANAMKPFHQMAVTIAENLARITIPDISEEEIERWKENYQKWGEIGWSVIPEASYNFFNDFPGDKKTADYLAMQNCRNVAMDHMFEEMHNHKIKKSDLDSAIFCYKQKQYKACALLIFGLLDAKMIRYQPRNSRQVGKRATDKLRKNMNQKLEEEHYLMVSLYQMNFITCIETYFAPGNNFLKEPEIINRNFIDHGMNIREVRKRDCIQLFIALYNFDEFLEFIS